MFHDVFAHALGLGDSSSCVSKPAPDGPDALKMQRFMGKYFGVFAGVTRSAKHALPNWPVNVHGCIGYWDTAFEQVRPTTLCRRTFKVAADAVARDDRRSYFPDLLTDVDAELDIKFMCLPIREVDELTGTFVDDGSPFNNKVWGLIVQTKAQTQAHRATYLPGVYPDVAWDTIKASVQSKANLRQGEKGEKLRFVAYRTKCSALSLQQVYAQVLRTNPVQMVNKIGCPFIEFFNTCKSVPYAVSADQTVLYDDTQDVRNVATLLDVQQLSEVVHCRPRQFETDVLHFVIKYVTRPSDMRQASTFLLTLLQRQSKFPRMQRQIERRLSDELSLMEPEFELGEALVALQKRAQMRTPRSIFELNWQAQASPHIELRNQLRTYVAEFTPSTETNYLAVAFEAACALRMPEEFTALFGQLMQRYDAEKGLFMFLDQSSRVDITAHVHGGLMSLL